MMKFIMIKNVWIMTMLLDISDKSYVRDVIRYLIGKLKKLTAAIQAGGDGFHI
tara:strand:- start:676 stop:834 length:159 start_codon:yes stop_codon:yes gene_type:complete